MFVHFKCCIMIELTFLKELMLIKQIYQISVIFVSMVFLKFQQNFCNRCHYLLMMSINLRDIAVLNIEGSDCHCIISLNRKNEAINLLQNTDLTEKIVIL